MPHLVLAAVSSTIHKVVELCFSAENVQVHCFSDGNSTLEYLKTQPVDVLLADVSGPDLDGYEICRQIKQNPGTGHVPVILMVGPLEDFDADRAEQVGCDRCLSKPFRTLALVEIVKDLLSMPAVSGDRSRVDLGGLGTLVDAPISPGSADVFSLTPSECQAPAFSYTRQCIGMRRTPGDEEAGNSAGNLPGKEEMDRVADRLVELVRRELPRLLREVASG